MKLTKMLHPRKPCHLHKAKQRHVDTTPLPSPAPDIPLFSKTCPTDDKFKVKISYGGAASPVKRPQLKMATPPKVSNESAQGKWQEFTKIQQDRPYNKKPPFKRPRKA